MASHKDIIDEALEALNRDTSEGAGLLRKYNICREDVCGATDWQFLRRKVATASYTTAGVTLSSYPFGVTLVRDASSIYYHCPDGVPLPGFGVPFWVYDTPTAAEAGPKIKLLDSDGNAITSASNVDIFYWVKPLAVTTDGAGGTIAWTDAILLPGTRAVFTLFAERLMGFEERGVNENQLESSKYQQALVEDIARNPKSLIGPPIIRGGMTLKTGDRL